MMDFAYRVPDGFGVLIPRDNGITWIKQGGGFSCIQRQFEGGVYLPIGKIKYHLGQPDWSPSGPNFEEKLRRIDLEEKVPQKDYNTFPPRVKRRNTFDGYNEYSNWVDSCDYYGWITLWDDLRRFTYGLFELLDSDPRNRWDSIDELWDAIRDAFNFRFEFVDRQEYRQSELNYPGPESAIRPIRVIGSKEGENRWAEYMSDDIVILFCPNED